jgi:integrase
MLYRVDDALGNALSRPGIDDFRSSDLHHTFANHLATRGVSLRAIVQSLGRKSLQMVTSETAQKS